MANTLRFKRGLASGLPTGLAGEPLFTTDTFDLYIGNGTTNTRFQKYIASGTTGQLLRGDGSLLTMPIVLTSPANGQVLKYDGTNWVNSADAGVTGSGTAGQVTYWGSSSTITGSNNLFWDAATNKLGIGISTIPADAKLAIKSTGSVAASIKFHNANTGDSATDGLYIGLGGSDTLQAYIFQRENAELIFATNATERARFHPGGNFSLGSVSDNGLRFQVTGDGYFSGSVGIARTPSASYKLHVAGDVAYEVTSGNVGFSLISASDSYSFYFNDADNSYRIYSSNGATDRLVLSSSGNLGLGVVPSAWSSVVPAFQIGSGGSFLAGRSANPEIYLGTNARFNGTNWLYQTTNTATYYAQDTGRHIWYQAPSGTAGNAITFTQAMTLDASGRLLVGGTSTYDFNDAAKLVVSNTSGNSTISIVSGTSSYGYLAFADGTSGTDRYTGAIEYNHSTNYMSFRTNGGNYVMNLTASQNVQIGSFGSDAGFKLDVNGTMRVSGASTLSGAVTMNASVSGNNPILELSNSNTLALEFTDLGQAANNRKWQFNANSGVFYFRAFNDARSSFTEIMQFTRTGAATFSSSVSTGGNISVNGLTLGRGLGNLITNSAFGAGTLGQNTSGFGNLALGYFSLWNNTSGYYNTAVGYDVLWTNTQGFQNVGIGFRALYNNTLGDDNIGIGYQAGNSNTTGNNNIFIGYQINGVSATESNRTWIGSAATTSTWLAGNLLLGSVTDLGDRFQVTGTTRLMGQTRVESHFLQSGAGLFRIENTGSSAPTGSTGLGLELFRSGSIAYVEAYNRTTAAYEQLNLRGSTINLTGAATFSSSVTSTQFRLSALNTAPATSSSTGTLGEIRIDADHIYICTATNTWKRVAIATF